MGKTTKLTNEEFIRRSKEAQSKEYGYDNVEYQGCQNIVSIYCFDHAQYFTQNAGAHMLGHMGCKECKRELKSALTKERYNLGTKERKCLKCGKIKPFSDFSKKGKDKMGNTAYQNVCKDCSKIMSREYYYKNREIILEDKKEYYIKNRDHILQYNKDNAERIFLVYREWYTRNAEEIRKRSKNRTEEQKAIRAKWARERRKKDPSFALECRIRNRVSGVLKKHETSKAYKTFKLLGCTALECVEYLNTKASNGYTFGADSIEVDHIIPCSFFDLTDPDQQKICFNYKNLQLLTKEENMAKSDSLPDNLDALFSEIYGDIKGVPNDSK